MQRRKPTNTNQADAIFTSDWHLREDHPVCRTDDFWLEQWRKLDFISDVQKQHDCPVVHAGDLFDFWKPSPMLLSKAIEHLPAQFLTVYGNHDLPQHNMELAYKSGVHCLEKAGRLAVLPGQHWGQAPAPAEHPMLRIGERDVLVWHVMTWQGKEPWYGCKDDKSSTLLRKYTEPDVLLTGHNHKPFTEKLDGRLLLNPGSIFRMNADQDDYRPAVWLYYADTNTVEPVYLPIKEGVVSRQHIEVKQERDNRIDAFISTLNQDWEVEMSFEQNIEIFKEKNNVPEDVMQLVYESIKH